MNKQICDCFPTIPEDSVKQKQKCKLFSRISEIELSYSWKLISQQTQEIKLN